MLSSNSRATLVEEREVSQLIQNCNILDFNRLLAHEEAKIFASHNWDEPEEFDSLRKKLNKLSENEKSSYKLRSRSGKGFKIRNISFFFVFCFFVFLSERIW